MSGGKKPALLVALFSEIPEDGAEWAFDRRKLWLETLQHVLDLIYADYDDERARL